MSSREKRLALLLLASFAYFYPSVGHNEAARFDLTRALALDGTLAVDAYRYNSADLVESGGRSYSNKAPGASLLAVPGFLAAGFGLRPLGLEAARYWDAVAWLATLLSLGLLSTLGAVATHRLVERISDSPAWASRSVVALWLGTLIFPYSVAFFGHVQAAALIAIALALSELGGGDRALLAAGGCAGFAIATEYPSVLLAAALLVFVVFKEASGRWQRGRAFGAGVSIGLVPLLVYQRAAFGSAFFASYAAYVRGGFPVAYPGHEAGLVGVAWPGVPAFLHVLGELTLGAQRGLLTSCPVLVLALPGLFLLWRARRPAAALVAACAAGYLAFNACYGDSIVYWGGASCTGPRHLVPLLPLLALPLAFGARRWPWAFAPLLALSAFLMLIATATEIRAGYAVRSPALELHVPAWLRSDLAQTRATLFVPPAFDGVNASRARNLGGVMGLPAPLQLWPLLASWVALGPGLLFEGDRRGGLVLALWALAVALPPLIHALG